MSPIDVTIVRGPSLKELAAVKMQVLPFVGDKIQIGEVQQEEIVEVIHVVSPIKIDNGRSVTGEPILELPSHRVMLRVK